MVNFATFKNVGNKQLDKLSTKALIESGQLGLHNDRKNCEDSFKQIFTVVKNLCQKYEISVMILKSATIKITEKTIQLMM